MSINYKAVFLILSVFTVNAGFTQFYDSLKVSEAQVAVEANGVVLHGIITLPKKEPSKMPVALIIPGSGATDRNGNNIAQGLNCNSYRQLAYALAEKGIASLRYDKRNVGESKMTVTSTMPKNFQDEVDDAVKIISFLKKDKWFSEVIVIGHSQGSLIGMLAAKGKYRFISLAGLGQKGSTTLREQLSVQPKIVGDSTNPIIDSLEMGYTVKHIPPFLETIFKESMQPYLIAWFKHDPAIVLSKMKKKSLIIQGSNDIQVKVADAKRLVSLSSKSKLIIIENMNHIFKIVNGGREENLKSYSNPDLPISVKLVEEIVNFILR